MWVDLVVSGLAVGSFYAIVALGFSMIFGVSRVFNLAHGELVVLAGYISYILWKSLGMGFWLTIPSAILVILILGLVLYRIFRLIEEPIELNTIVFTFGLAIFFQSLMVILFSANYRIIRVPEWSRILKLYPLSLSITEGEIILLVTSLLLVLCLYLLLRHTFWGKGLRATIQDKEAAELVGINTKQTAFLAFMLGIGLVGLSGPFFATFHYIYPSGGLEATIVAIVITVFAGVGHVRAIIWSGWILALIEGLVSVSLGTGWKEGVSALVLIAIFIYRPQGISGVK